MKECAYCKTRNDDRARKCSECGAVEFQNVCANCSTVYNSGFCPTCGVAAGDYGWVCPTCNANVFGAYCSRCGYTISAPQKTVVEYVHVEAPRSQAAPPQYGVGYGYGNPQQGTADPISTVSNKRKDILICIWCCGVWGCLPFYYWYVGRRPGFFRVITMNYFFIGGLVDLVAIATGTFRDGNGQQIKETANSLRVQQGLPKLPIYKQWWFYVIGGTLLLSLLISSTGGGG